MRIGRGWAAYWGLIGVCIIGIIWMVFFMDHSVQRFSVTYEDFGNGISCYVWGGAPVNCEVR